MARGNFGERLKREREMREVSVNEVTSATRIGPRFLEALENEDWEKLPGGIFNRGFVRAIARFLGLDEEDLLAEYDLAHGEQKIEAPAPYQNQIPSPPKWIPALAVLAFVALLVGMFYAGRFGWHKYTAHRAARHSVATAQIAPSPVVPMTEVPSGAPSSAAPSVDAPTLPEPPAVQAPQGPSADRSSVSKKTLDLAVSTSAVTRVRVRGDGRLLLDRHVRPGDTHHFSATRQFDVMAADSGVVLLELNGQAMPAIGEPGASGTIHLTEKDLGTAQRGKPQR
ncbi:MAG: DUF4115 domain-containing protein [Candidatus Acidiferrum sp.]